MALSQVRLLQFGHAAVPAGIEREIARKTLNFLPQVLDELFETAVTVRFESDTLPSFDFPQNHWDTALRKLLKYRFSFRVETDSHAVDAILQGMPNGCTGLVMKNS